MPLLYEEKQLNIKTFPNIYLLCKEKWPSVEDLSKDETIQSKIFEIGEHKQDNSTIPVIFLPSWFQLTSTEFDWFMNSLNTLHEKGYKTFILRQNFGIENEEYWNKEGLLRLQKFSEKYPSSIIKIYRNDFISQKNNNNKQEEQDKKCFIF